MRRAALALGAILAGAVLLVWAIQAGLDIWGERGDPDAAEFLPSIYLVPEGARERGDLLLAPKVMARAGMAVVTPAEVPVAAALRPEIAVIYLHPGVVARVDPAWLREPYQAGTVIVALNTPPSALGSRLGVEAQMPDPPLGRLLPGQMFYSIYYAYRHSDGAVEGQAADWQPTLDRVPCIADEAARAIAEVKRDWRAPARFDRR